MYRLSEDDLIKINKAICSTFNQEYNVLNYDALSRNLNAYESFYEDDYHIASAIFRSIITNHAFKDANKRTAFLTLQLLLPSKIGADKISQLAVDVAMNTSMSVDDICEILYPQTKNESLNETAKPTYTYSYIGPVYRFENIYTVLKEPVYTTAQNRKQAATMLKGKLKQEFGFDYKAKLDIDEENIRELSPIELEDEQDYYSYRNNKLDNHDEDDMVGYINGKPIYFEDGYYTIGGIGGTFISFEEAEEYLQ